MALIEYLHNYNDKIPIYNDHSFVIKELLYEPYVYAFGDLNVSNRVGFKLNLNGSTDLFLTESYDVSSAAMEVDVNYNQFFYIKFRNQTTNDLKKYDKDFKLIWTASTGKVSGGEVKKGLFYRDGFLYIGFDNFSAKYDRNGNLIWMVSTPQNSLTQITVDGLGNSYYVYRGTNPEPSLIKLDPDGDELWGQNYKGCDKIGIEFGNDDYIYIGRDTGNQSDQPLKIKTSDGTIESTTSGTIVTNPGNGGSIVIKDGFIYILSAMRLYKIDEDFETIIWEIIIPAFVFGRAFDITFDYLGYFYTSQQDGGLIRKYDESTRTLIWTYTPGGTNLIRNLNVFVYPPPYGIFTE